MMSQFIKRFMKTVMVTTPFFIMILMVLALWGVGGKATYLNLNPAKQKMEFGAKEAKNFLVNGKQSQDLSSPELVTPNLCEEQKSNPPEKEKLPKKIELGRTV